MTQKQLIILILSLLALFPFLFFETKFWFANHPWFLKKQIRHKKFGKLWYINDKKKPEYSHYQGHIYFAPANKEIDIFLTSKIEFDSKQTLFFREIEKRYQNLYPECLNLLENHFKTKLEDLLLSSISISKSSNLSQTWSLGYYSKKNNLLSITINFQGWEIKNIQ